MTSKPVLIDLFCGGGGAGMGYHRAGFKVIGVDLAPQKNYPFEFHQADALTFPLEGAQAVHASPPCQGGTTMSNKHRGKGTLADERVNLLSPTLDRIRCLQIPWVVENVLGYKRVFLSRHVTTIVLHGGMFGLGTDRPRLFGSNMLLFAPDRCAHVRNGLGVYGREHDGRRLWGPKEAPTLRAPRTLEEGQAALGIDWMEWTELKESIPPAYTEWIGEQLLAVARQGVR